MSKAYRSRTRDFGSAGSEDSDLQPLHGWLSARTEQVRSHVLQVSDGSLYPALHKLEQQGWIQAEWKSTENNRRAKFYSLTRLGRRHLEREAANLGSISTAISGVMRLKESEHAYVDWFTQFRAAALAA